MTHSHLKYVDPFMGLYAFHGLCGFSGSCCAGCGEHCNCVVVWKCNMYCTVCIYLCATHVDIAWNLGTLSLWLINNIPTMLCSSSLCM